MSELPKLQPQEINGVDEFEALATEALKRAQHLAWVENSRFGLKLVVSNTVHPVMSADIPSERELAVAAH